MILYQNKTQCNQCFCHRTILVNFSEAEQISDETEQEATIAKREPASVLDRLKQPLPPCNPAGKKHNEREM